MKKSLVLLMILVLVGSLRVVGAACSDDDGKDLNTTGTASLFENHEDYCSNSYIYEYFCRNSNVLIHKGDTFYVDASGDKGITYKHADKITDPNPQVLFRVEKEVSDSVLFLNPNGTFIWKFNGITWYFKNASNMNQDDFDILLLGSSYWEGIPINKNEYFYLTDGSSDYEIRYKHADKITDPNPQVLFRVEKEVSDSVLFLNPNGTFIWKFNGITWYFKNASNMNQDDFKIQFLGNELLLKQKVLCPSGICLNGACIQQKTECPWDVNNDGRVNVLDLIEVRNHLNKDCSQAAFSPPSNRNLSWGGGVIMVLIILALVIAIVKYNKTRTRQKRRR